LFRSPALRATAAPHSPPVCSCSAPRLPLAFSGTTAKITGRRSALSIVILVLQRPDLIAGQGIGTARRRAPGRPDVRQPDPRRCRRRGHTRRTRQLPGGTALARLAGPAPPHPDRP